jgi:hypothetical protein
MFSTFISWDVIFSGESDHLWESKVTDSLPMCFVALMRYCGGGVWCVDSRKVEEGTADPEVGDEGQRPEHGHGDAEDDDQSDPGESEQSQIRALLVPVARV